MSLTPITYDLSWAALLGKDAGQHKFNHGSALVLSGPMGRSGAARLAARAALRTGAGLVTLVAPPSSMAEIAAQITAVMLRTMEELSDLLSDIRVASICVGPGFGVGADCRDVVAQVLAAGRGVVLDADSLSSFADAPEDLFALTRGTKTVLTPHEGEFARLFPDLNLSDRAAACAEAVDRAGCVVLLKGSATVVCGDRQSIHNPDGDRDAPWLATAGSGDVLAGIITGLLARGAVAQLAGEAGVWLHAEAARIFGPGLIAEDLPEMLPKVFASRHI